MQVASNSTSRRVWPTRSLDMSWNYTILSRLHFYLIDKWNLTCSRHTCAFISYTFSLTYSWHVFYHIIPFILWSPPHSCTFNFILDRLLRTVRFRYSDMCKLSPRIQVNWATHYLCIGMFLSWHYWWTSVYCEKISIAGNDHG